MDKEVLVQKKKFSRSKVMGIMKKSVPLYLVISIAFNSTLAVALVQHFYFMNKIEKLISSDLSGNTELSDEEILKLEAELFPENGIILPVKWGDIGKKLVDTGVIDEEKFLELFKGGPLSGVDEQYVNILAGKVDENIVVTQENSRFVLNTLWALGLAQQSKVLTDMHTEYPKDIGNLASTGGWSIGQADAMDYYNKHNILNLNDEQQQLVKSIAENIFRPCCDNHTAFADCNHGMAMLGLIEMMVAEGYSEDQIYASALAVNTMWFPDTYLTIAKFLKDEYNVAWEDVDTKQVLGIEFSSGSGYGALLSQINPVEGSGSGGGCGV